MAGGLQPSGDRYPRRWKQTVAAILQEVRQDGDEAVRKYSLQFDKVAPDRWNVESAEIEAGGGIASMSP